jgi:nucleoside-diphosphate-sugar epimerase
LKLNHVDVRGAVELGPGRVFYKEWRISMIGKDESCVTLYFRVGSSFPVFQIEVLGSDGVIKADMVRNWSAPITRSKWPDAYDHMTSVSKYGNALVNQAKSGFRDFVFCQLGIKPRGDAFYKSMKDSIKAFHTAMNSHQSIESDGEFGAKIVSLCEDIAAYVPKAETPETSPPNEKEAREACDVAVLGGTGFIGRALVQQLVDAGKALRVMARGTANLPAIFHHPNVQLISGDVRKEADIRRCIKGADYVVNLAHGGGGATREAIYQALVGSAKQVGEICLEERVKQLVFISSIAALYLGNEQDIITPLTKVDEKSERRNDYAWAKAGAEREMLRLHKENGLNIYIQRPGLVVGEGTSPLHSGLGFFNNEQHCIGWNKGQNPLPFVLVEDTASAIVQALGREDLAGKCDNIIGEVRPNARTYYNHLRQLSGRPLCYHPQNPLFLQLSEIFKWVIKRISGRNAPFPSYRDILSRGLKARFDCTETKANLDWSPCADEDQFYRQAIEAVIGHK